MTDSKDDKKKYTIEFAPGAFDNFDGTQDELDDLITTLTEMAESGELLENSEPIDYEDLSEEEREIIEALSDFFSPGDSNLYDDLAEAAKTERKRKLN